MTIEPKLLDPKLIAVAADRIVEFGIVELAAQGVGPADAGRALLAAVARWFGIDFGREVDVVLEESERE